MKKENLNKQERILVLAERVKLLFGFCAELIPDLDLLKEVTISAADKEDFALSAAPILGAFGRDWEADHNEAQLRTRRSEALYELVKVLDETEKGRMEFKISQDKKKEGRDMLARAMGL